MQEDRKSISSTEKEVVSENEKTSKRSLIMQVNFLFVCLVFKMVMVTVGRTSLRSYSNENDSSF